MENQPRLHLDPRRSAAQPALAEIQAWCADVALRDQGVRECIAEARGIITQARGARAAHDEIAVGAAAGIRLAAREIHDLAREFGFDPRSHEDVAEVAEQLCVLRVSTLTHPQGAMLERQADDMWHDACTMIELRALSALSLGMIVDGVSAVDTLRDVAIDARPETAAMIAAITGTDEHRTRLPG